MAGVREFCSRPKVGNQDAKYRSRIDYIPALNKTYMGMGVQAQQNFANVWD
ncbi:unnamed protein product [marine sediment metagenome]|uniref:Uncharacterized protein n=1 Tax=marine sediment metagenome TaxID=412755 RepID=X0WHL7_9ZZZZ